MRITTDSSDDAVLEELGDRLRQLRLGQNRSQTQLAEEAGVGRGTVQRIESGESASLVSVIRVLRSLDLLDGLDRFIPEPGPGPLDLLRRQGRPRRRAGSPRGAATPKDEVGPWRWGDEGDHDGDQQ